MEGASLGQVDSLEGIVAVEGSLDQVAVVHIVVEAADTVEELVVEFVWVQVSVGGEEGRLEVRLSTQSLQVCLDVAQSSMELPWVLMDALFALSAQWAFLAGELRL
jgi:hypothetical protein